MGGEGNRLPLSDFYCTRKSLSDATSGVLPRPLLHREGRRAVGGESRVRKGGYATGYLRTFFAHPRMRPDKRAPVT